MRTQTIVFGADQANRWNQGAYEVWILHGHCFLSQGLTTSRSDDAVLWVRRGGEFGNRQNLVITYLEGNVRIDYQRAGFPYQLTDNSWLGEFYSISPIEVRVQNPASRAGGQARRLPQCVGQASRSVCQPADSSQPVRTERRRRGAARHPAARHAPPAGFSAQRGEGSGPVVSQSGRRRVGGGHHNRREPDHRRHGGQPARWIFPRIGW